MQPKVLAVGLDPAVADFSRMPNLTPALVKSFIDGQLQRVRDLGYDVDDCLVDLGATAERVVEQRLAKKRYDCVVIGAGLYDKAQLLLFEKIINVLHAQAPQAKICFNSTPADTAEAVRRWV